jgi:purine-cytosine permease-like protein
VNWGSALSIVLTFSILAWTYKLSTTSRFAVPASRTGGMKASYFLAPSVGIMLAVLVFGVLGAYSNEATGNWNIALLGSSISGWGFVAAVGAALAVIHTNSMNLYPSTVDLLVALNNIRKPTRWQQPLATIGLGVLGTVLAIAGILDHVQTLITDAGDIIIPFTFVMLVDWLWVQRRRTPAAAFFRYPRRLSDRFVPGAIVAVAIGFVFGFWGDKFMPGFFYNTLPLPVVAGVIAAILYALAVAFWPPPQAALAVSDRPAAQPGSAS